jgi:hypothetical protein
MAAMRRVAMTGNIEFSGFDNQHGAAIYFGQAYSLTITLRD